MKTLVEQFPQWEGEHVDAWCRRLADHLEMGYWAEDLPEYYREAIWQVLGYLRRLEGGGGRSGD